MSLGHQIFILSLTVLTSQASLANCIESQWIKQLRENNHELIQMTELQRLNKETAAKRIKPITIAVIGNGTEVEDFKNIIDINHAEIPDNGIDDDLNGFVDDYYGFDFSKNTGKNFNHFTSPHETQVSSTIAMTSFTHCQEKYPIKILPLKISADGGVSNPLYIKYLADAIQYATMRGARVINMSLGLSFEYESFFKFIDEDVEKSKKYLISRAQAATDKNVILVAGVSNDPGRNIDVEAEAPCSLKSVICVTGVNKAGELTRAFGRDIDAAFYSESIGVYAGDKDFSFEDGTSFAAPIISAVIAMKLAMEPKLGLSFFKKAIQSNLHLKVITAKPLKAKLLSPKILIYR